MNAAAEDEMTSQQPVEIKSGAPLDTILLALAFVALAGGITVFYWFQNQWPAVVRVLVVLAGLGAAAALAYQTQAGKTMWSYVRGSQVELRKTTWPTRQESLQATLMIALIVVVFAFILWILDAGLLWAVRHVTERS